jgi:hypothetical protein
MQASLTGIRQSFTDIRHRWSQAKLKKSVVFWIAIGAIVLTLFLGFTQGGWTTDGAAKQSADSAVLARLTPICVAQFEGDPQRALKLEELRAVGSFQRAVYVKDQGWATMPGEAAPDHLVATECAKRLVLLGK